MSKTGWTFRQAKNAKEAGELMCASLRRVGDGWHVELHEWDGFKGPVEDDNERPICFETADMAIQAIAKFGFECDHFLNPSKPDTHSCIGDVEDVSFVMSANGKVRIAVEKTALQVI